MPSLPVSQLDTRPQTPITEVKTGEGARSTLAFETRLDPLTALFDTLELGAAIIVFDALPDLAVH